MKVIVSRKEVRELVSGMGKVISKSSHMPILQGVKLEVLKDRLTVTATDLESVVIYHFPNAIIEQEGACVVDFSLLKDLSKGGKDVIELESKGDNGEQISVVNHIGAQAVNLSRNGYPIDEFPEVSKPITTYTSKDFLQTYQRLVPFASTDETRYAITSIFLDVSKVHCKENVMVATDGRRLSIWSSDLPKIEESVILPISKFLSWTKLEGEANEVEIGSLKAKDVTWFGVNIGHWEYRVKTKIVTYPNYRQVIPSEWGDNQVIFAEEDIETLGAIFKNLPDGSTITMAPTKKQQVLIQFLDSQNSFKITLKGASQYLGKDPISLNPSFLLDALQAGFREFHIADFCTPILSTDNLNGVHVLMPMKTVPIKEEAENTEKTGKMGQEANETSEKQSQAA